MTASPDQASLLIQSLGWLFDHVAPAPLDDSDVEPGTCEGEIDRWIRVACAGAGTAGFVANLGGVFTLPIALPANLMGVAAIQLRLIARIAACRGYKVDSDEVRALAVACLTGSAALGLAREAGVKLGEKVVAHLSGLVIARLNRAVGNRLLLRAGTAGAANLARFVPLVGGVIGGTVDAAGTKAVGEIAKRVFPRRVPAIQAPEVDPVPALPAPPLAGPDIA